MIEVVPLKKLNSRVRVPGSKYIANRVLLIAALADGISLIKNIPENEDIDATIEALGRFGIKTTKKNEAITIHGTQGKIKSPTNNIDARNSGTLMRFIAGFACLADGKTIITGSERIKQRPIDDLLKSLNELGVKCNSLNNGFPPIEVIGGALKGGKTRIKGDISSQFISSLLLVAPYAKNDVEIIVEGELVSKSYVDMTIRLMKEFGIDIQNENYKKFRIKIGQKYKAKIYTIPADWSSANYFFAAAAIVPGRVEVEGIDFSEKGESGFINLLQKMGCEVNKKKNSVEVIGKSDLKAMNADMSMMPDSAQTLAAVSVFAKGATRIRNIGNLKFKESDRINDTAEELKKLGIKAIAKEDELVIEGGIPSSAVIDPHNDHRMAMSFALVGLKAPGIRIKNHESVGKSFPNFWNKLEEIGIKLKMPKNIVLMGYRGTGKTFTAGYLAKKLGRKIVSTDREIEKKVGKIRDFIEENNWDKFRQVESEVIRSIKGNNLVIDSGGGFIEREGNIKKLKENGIIIWLKASPQQIRKRIGSDDNRPSLTGKKSFADEIEEILKKRNPIYKKAADYEVDTDKKTISQIGEEILELIKDEM